MESLTSIDRDEKEFECDELDSTVNLGNFSFDVSSFFMKTRFAESDENYAEPFCDSVTTTIFPQELPNLNNEFVTLVNHGRFKQKIIIEQCKSVVNN